VAKEQSIEVEWRAYELRPEGMEIPEKSPEYIERAKVGIMALSKKYGLEMKWNDKTKHSRLALEGAKFAEEKGLANEYHDAVFVAQFQEQKNINDLETLIQIAKPLGFNEEDFREALISRRYGSAVEKDNEEARRMGITGIPCFISNGQGKMGVQTYEELIALEG